MMTGEAPSFSIVCPTGVPSTPLIPARAMIAISGSCRSSAASSESSRKDENTWRGATRTAGARSHQFRSRAELRESSAVVTTSTRVLVHISQGEVEQHEVRHGDDHRNGGQGA